MSERTQKALIALRRILRATEFSARRLAKNAALTNSQLIVLQILGEEGEASAGAIAKRTALSQATVTSLLDRLEGRDLLRRRRGDRDRRRVWVELTPAGQAMLEQFPSSLQTQFQGEFDQLADWEQAWIVAALERVAAMLKADRIDAAPMLEMGEIADALIADTPLADTSAAADREKEEL
ncbi:MAG TPA: MarR family winged helix-turn-helix transcriptional regulator [Kiloniellales bacterium]|nr:MarR family winged helix-turn-helix transcriptional regulator [Kiloniellales bacterium]